MFKMVRQTDQGSMEFSERDSQLERVLNRGTQVNRLNESIEL